MKMIQKGLFRVCFQPITMLNCCTTCISWEIRSYNTQQSRHNEHRHFCREILNMINRRWGGAGVKSRLELFRKFIRFWRAIRPYAKGGLQKCAKFIHRKEWKWFCWCSSKGIPISRFGEDVKRKEKWSLKSVGRWLAVSVVARKILTCKSKMYKIENSLQLQNDILRRTLEGWAKEEPEVNKQINDKNFSVSLAKDFPFWLLMPSLYGADKRSKYNTWMKKVSLVSSDGAVTSFHRSLLSFHSPMLARFVWEKSSNANNMPSTHQRAQTNNVFQAYAWSYQW